MTYSSGRAVPAAAPGAARGLSTGDQGMGGRHGLTVLFLAADLPWPPDGGGRLATLRFLQAFAANNTVDLVAMADLDSEPELGELSRICRRVTVVSHPFTLGRHRARQMSLALRSMGSTAPYRLRKFRSATFRSAIAQMVVNHQYDLVHYDQLGAAQYFDRSFASTYECQNVESDIYRLAAGAGPGLVSRAWAWQEALKLRRAEKRLVRKFDEVFVLADDDGDLIRAMGADHVRVVPMPSPPIDPARPAPREPVIISIGSMSWFGVETGLLWFYRNVYPLIRERVPAARWMLVGPNASGAIRELDGSDGITVTGYVADIAQAARAARCAIVPLWIAGGIRMKLLDLLAWGVPAVSTTLGARGLGMEDGAGCFMRDDAPSFAEAVVNLLEDGDLWLSTTERGRTYLRANHGPASAQGAIEAGLAEAVDSYRRRVERGRRQTEGPES